MPSAGKWPFGVIKMWKALSGALMIAIVLTAPASAEAASVMWTRIPVAGQEMGHLAGGDTSRLWDARGLVGKSSLRPKLAPRDDHSLGEIKIDEDVASVAPQVPSPAPRSTHKSRHHVLRQVIVFAVIGVVIAIVVAIGSAK